MWTVFDVDSVCCGQCLMWTVFAVDSVCCGQCLLWSVFAVDSVCCGQCLLWTVFAVDSVCCGGDQVFPNITSGALFLPLHILIGCRMVLTPPGQSPTAVPPPITTPQVAKFLEARVAGVDQGEEHWCRHPSTLRLLLETLLLAVRHNGLLRSAGPVAPGKRESSPEAQAAALLTRVGEGGGAVQAVQQPGQERASEQVH